jgi:hypothetical protein
VILRELLTGSRSDDENSPRRLAGDLEAIVRRALRPDPARRYPSVDHLAEDQPGPIRKT